MKNFKTNYISIFGILMMINFPLFYLLFDRFTTYKDISLAMRTIAFVLCCILSTHNYWNAKYKKYLKILWYSSITFCLPFFFMFMCMINNLSLYWLLNLLSSIFFLLLITSILEFFFTFITGSLLAIIIYSSYTAYFGISLYQEADLSLLFGVYIAPIIIGSVFSHKRDQIHETLSTQKQKVQKKVITLEEELKKQNASLKKALEAKERFLGNMSHEIRTPLHGILNLANMVNEKWNNFSENERKNLVEKVASNSNRLMSLVSNLLDISTMIKNKLKIFKQQHNLVKIAEEVVDEFTSPFQNIRISFNSSNKRILCLCDKERISRVVRNLISNAIKYGNHKPIEIKIIVKGNAAILSVIDQGVGIPKDELEKIFNPFEESSRTKTSAGGTGLGLAICKEIIVAHGGKISVKNNYKVGSIFSFQLPLIVETKKPISSQSKSNIMQHSAFSKGEKTIMIVDDEETVLFSTSMRLEFLGYKVITAQGGPSALKLLEDTVPDAILLDLMMPGMNGDKVLQQIRNSKRLKKIPVILNTGIIDEKKLSPIHKLGISGVLHKPYDEKQLREELEKIFNE